MTLDAVSPLEKLKHLVAQLIDALSAHPDSDALLLGHLHTIAGLVDDVAAQPHYDIAGDVLQVRQQRARERSRAAAVVCV